MESVIVPCDFKIFQGQISQDKQSSSVGLIVSSSSHYD